LSQVPRFFFLPAAESFFVTVNRSAVFFRSVRSPEIDSLLRELSPLRRCSVFLFAPMRIPFTSAFLAPPSSRWSLDPFPSSLFRCVGITRPPRLVHLSPLCVYVNTNIHEKRYLRHSQLIATLLSSAVRRPPFSIRPRSIFIPLGTFSRVRAPALDFKGPRESLFFTVDPVFELAVRSPALQSSVSFIRKERFSYGY